MKSTGTRTRFLEILAGLTLAWFAASGTAIASCSNAAGTTHGPFSYTAANPSFYTIEEYSGPYPDSNFTVTAPADGTFFPGQGQNRGECLESALANFKVFEIEKIADGEGNTLDPAVHVDSNSSLYQTLALMFSFNPPRATFTPGSSQLVTVTISSPGHVADEDYGDYKVKLGSQAPGAGIGVGSGAYITLRLTGDEEDETPPNVSVTCPANGSTKLLGEIDVCVEAYDQADGTGVAQMKAWVSSAGGAVSDLEIPLTPSPSLPVSGATLVTATGSFTPAGGAPGAGTGTSLGQAFFFNNTSDKSLSGNGSYTITAKAWDGAGNEGTGSSTFLVKYNAQFSEASGNVNTGRPANSQGKFKFTLHRGSSLSDGASDGAFMFDKTVSVVLARVLDDAPMATHFYGTAGGILLNVLINQTDPLNPFYETHFKRGDLIDPNTGLAPTASGLYVVKIYIRSVDGSWMLQATSSSVTF